MGVGNGWEVDIVVSNSPSVDVDSFPCTIPSRIKVKWVTGEE